MYHTFSIQEFNILYVCRYTLKIYVLLSAGQTQCDKCPDNTFSEEKADQCEDCPTGTDASIRNSMENGNFGELLIQKCLGIYLL